MNSAEMFQIDFLWRANVDEVMNFSFIVIYLVVPVLGIALNCYVFVRLVRIARKNAVRFETTSGLPLCAMSVSDSVCLFAEFTQVLFHVVVVQMVPKNVTGDSHMLNLFCKLDIFLMHTTSAFSVWCWLMLSVLRYTAVFHPLKYRTIWRQPRYALKLLCLICLCFESWILFVVVYLPGGTDHPGMCAESTVLDPKRIRMAHMMDICFFYAIPAILRIFFDGVVLFHCYSPFGTIEEPASLYERRYAISLPSAERRASTTELDALATGANMALVVSMCQQPAQHLSKKRELYLKRRTTMIMRSIIISALNLLCNLPHHIHRTWLTLKDQDLTAEEENTEFSKYMESITQVLYFSQFACNAFYLSTSIYETSAQPRGTTVIANYGKHVSRCESNES